MQLPVLLPSQVQDKEDPGRVMFDDDGEWPGGMQQRLRYLRPHVDGMLEGYTPQFVGIVEVPEDGVGVWQFGSGDSTAIANANNLTFNGFMRVIEGDYGSRVLEAGHTILAVNCSFTSHKDIGQFWERGLKEKARKLIDEVRESRTYFDRGFGLTTRKRSEIPRDSCEST